MPEMQRTSATSATILDSYELAQQVAEIRKDLQGVTSMVGRIVNTQVGRAKDAAVDTGTQAQEAIKQNPISALLIAVGLGFLFGIFMRR
jgi:ElaB/YqjD/DUF883 family membrane-anchored ribosome-binding protein